VWNRKHDWWSWCLDNEQKFLFGFCNWEKEV